MAQSESIKEFIRQVETYAGRKFNYPAEVGELLQVVDQTGSANDFEELIFQAKFLAKSREVMQRIGPATEGIERLSAEFQTSVKIAADRLKLLVEKDPRITPRQHFNEFLSVESSGIDPFLKLASDLRWIKNWEVDGMPLPYGRHEHPSSARVDRGGSEPKNRREQEMKSLARVRNCGALAAILLIVTVVIDPPVTTLGWTFSIVIVVLLAYIVLQLHVLIRFNHP
jgi:hypothetical protein